MTSLILVYFFFKSESCPKVFFLTTYTFSWTKARTTCLRKTNRVLGDNWIKGMKALTIPSTNEGYFQRPLTSVSCSTLYQNLNHRAIKSNCFPFHKSYLHAFNLRSITRVIKSHYLYLCFPQKAIRPKQSNVLFFTKYNISIIMVGNLPTSSLTVT